MVAVVMLMPRARSTELKSRAFISHGRISPDVDPAGRFVNAVGFSTPLRILTKLRPLDRCGHIVDSPHRLLTAHYSSKGSCLGIAHRQALHRRYSSSFQTSTRINIADKPCRIHHCRNEAVHRASWSYYRAVDLGGRVAGHVLTG